MSYVAELRQNWRPLLAATIGIGCGLSIHGTITSAIAPSMLADLGWSRSEFALLGSLGLFNAAVIPFIGRIADVIGVRRTALIGQAALPIAYLATSMMNGWISAYIAISLFTGMLGMTTTATVYTRLAVQNVKHARGLALAIVASGPAISGAIGGPILNAFVENHGWRDSFRALAVFAAIAGIVTFLLIPSERKRGNAERTARRPARQDYALIFPSPAFWLLFVAMLLCNSPQIILSSQLKILLLENGVSGPRAAVMFSALSVGLLVGRFVTGAALDRFNPYIVACVTLGLPSIGLFILASGFDARTVVLLAVFSFGFAFGAEGDVVAYIVARRFGLEVYSSVMGLLTAAMSISASLGAAFLSYILARTGGYDAFLIVTGLCVLVGAGLFLLLNGAGRLGTVTTKTPFTEPAT